LTSIVVDATHVPQTKWPTVSGLANGVMKNSTAILILGKNQGHLLIFE
jgi:hypothetical protein